jgi:hypothetical protein
MDRGVGGVGLLVVNLLGEGTLLAAEIELWISFIMLVQSKILV